MYPAESQSMIQHYYVPAKYDKYAHAQSEELAYAENQYRMNDVNADFYMRRLAAIRSQIEEELAIYAAKHQQSQQVNEYQLQPNNIESHSADTTIGKRSTLWHNVVPFINDRLRMTLLDSEISPYSNSLQAQREYEYPSQIPPNAYGNHHHQQQPSSCGKNLLIGCQPHVQHVPCSSSYESHLQPYPIQAYPVQPAPIYPGLTSPHIVGETLVSGQTPTVESIPSVQTTPAGINTAKSDDSKANEDKKNPPTNAGKDSAVTLNVESTSAMPIETTNVAKTKTDTIVSDVHNDTEVSLPQKFPTPISHRHSPSHPHRAHNAHAQYSHQPNPSGVMERVYNGVSYLPRRIASAVGYH